MSPILQRNRNRYEDSIPIIIQSIVFFIEKSIIPRPTDVHDPIAHITAKI